MASLYKDLVRARIPTDNHESDLYVLDTPEARETIKKYGYKFTTFTSNIDGKRWIDVPFAYEPFWEKKQQAQIGAPSGERTLEAAAGPNVPYEWPKKKARKGAPSSTKSRTRHHATKPTGASGGGWTTEHKASGATAIERHAFGAKLTVVPVTWADPSGPANWTVTRGSAQQVGFDHKRGHAASVKGAKAAAMQAAKDMPRRGAGAVRSHATKKPASAGGAQKLVAAAQKAHKGPWRTDLVVATIKKLWGSNAAANAKKIWRYFRDDAHDVLNARFWADIYLNKMGGTYD